uniref:Uncharacterized protein LOC104235370 n=1 Tax=Nicotiana sylvestris TaxID=4096 RepID=A0A1U7XKD3_NICSY|nr:PREDICTED: uncharacterized protein LOC104235370 [Nicotiana sylvestris]
MVSETQINLSSTANNSTSPSLVCSVIQPSQLVSFNPASQLSLKLNGSTNYSIWKAQVTTLLFVYDLIGYIDGSSKCPAQFIIENNLQLVNPNYKLWQRQDSLVCNTIMAFVNHSIAPIIAHVVTAKHAWETLQTIFASKSQSRIFGLREILANLRKETRPVANYMKEIKTIADDLAYSGSPLTNEELVIKVLSGLGPEFKEISAAIRARDNPISFEELYDKLLAHEVFVQYSEPKAVAPVVTAQFNQRVSNAQISQQRNYNNVGNQILQ